MDTKSRKTYTEYWAHLMEKEGLKPFYGDAGSSGRIFAYLDDDTAILRASFLSKEKRWNGDELGKYRLEDIEIGRTLLDGLSKYGFSVIARDEKVQYWRDYSIHQSRVPRVKGVTISESLANRAIPTDILEQHYSNIIKYYLEHGVVGDKVLVDLAREGRQFMYGTVEGDTEKNLYLVDTDPVWSEYVKEGGQHINRYYFTAVGYLKKEMEVVENGYGIKLGAMEKINELI
jgi:hypothetical protein